MGEYLEADLSVMRSAASLVDAAAEATADADAAGPLASVVTALPGSYTAPRAADCAFRLSAAAAVWAGHLADHADGVTASAADYAASDDRGSDRLRSAMGSEP